MNILKLLIAAAANAAFATVILVPVAVIIVCAAIQAVMPRLRPSVDAFMEKFNPAKVYVLVFLVTMTVFSLAGWSFFPLAPKTTTTTTTTLTDQKAAPANATALCRDGTYPYSQHRRGTCSHHGGVAQWLSR